LATPQYVENKFVLLALFYQTFFYFASVFIPFSKLFSFFDKKSPSLFFFALSFIL